MRKTARVPEFPDASSTAFPEEDAQPKLVLGTLALTLALGCGKWGAYLGVPPVFPLDLLLALAVIRWLKSRSWGFARFDVRLPLPAVLLLWYVILRLIVSDPNSIEVFQDAAPYAYSIVLFVAMVGIRVSTHADRARTFSLVSKILLFHLVWVTIAVMVPASANHLPLLPFGDVRLFSPQLATDGVIVGMTGSLYLFAFLSNGTARSLLLAMWAFGIVASVASRAALLGTAVAIALTLLVAPPMRASIARRKGRLAVLAAVPLVLIAVAGTLPATVAGSKLLSSIGIKSVGSASDAGGVATAAARDAAWNRVLEHVSEQNARAFGVGFGPNYMLDSDAILLLTNGAQDRIRSPHNVVVAAYARIGIVGLVLYSFVILTYVRSLGRLRIAAAREELALLAFIGPLPLLASGLFGPTLEGPFGAISFYWLMGAGIALASKFGCASDCVMRHQDMCDAPPR